MDLATPDEVERAVPIGEAIERRGERREVGGGTEQDPRSRNFGRDGLGFSEY